MQWNMLLWFAGAALAGAIGGAASGVKLGGEAIGNQTAALMGGFFGLSAVVPAALVVTLVLAAR